MAAALAPVHRALGARRRALLAAPGTAIRAIRATQGSVARAALTTMVTMALSIFCAPIEVLAQDANALETRLTRLERAVAGQGLLDLANQVAELQRDLRLMRGELEKQAYFTEQLRKAQSEQAGTLGAEIDTLVAAQAELERKQTEYAATLSTLSEATAAARLQGGADTAGQGHGAPPGRAAAQAFDAGQVKASAQMQAAMPDSNAAPDAQDVASAPASAPAVPPSPVRNLTPTVPMAAVLQGGAGMSTEVNGPPTADADAAADTAEAAQESVQATQTTAAMASANASVGTGIAGSDDVDPPATASASLTPPKVPNQVALTGVQQTATRDVPSEGAPVKAEYQDAFALLKSGDYPAAIVAFREFLLRNPQSEYADNAQYWLGESFYVTEDYPAAISEYQTLLDAFPDSQKFTHALLKIGYAQEAMGDQMAARNTLDRLTRDYPNTTAARLATERLRQFPPMPVEPEVVPAPAPVVTGTGDVP